ncbi:hypothetical protein TVAG_219950 [Trichomonas vaginalis G3]|uniref:Uncharacterized protein n=1 Tax=Trichomonas vaginalis (strain ATCC PRA-98 / G3) TaxID=412133 RepID=A2DXV1_TRIV3|nr:spectrin binding [Trichomonas vaginalis G3]EAY14811.1 hypothetical protein TVAG_219950 [Trichomonas vaginalis G3]KAI5508084.1 spectrin binding [Trichomonas vaginalis G3]|eukprot:XP_001327034.1 hypothetical protein [Trichomonas vaginalis G3]
MERTLTFTDDEFHQNSYCNSLNSQIQCGKNNGDQGYSCKTTDNISYPHDDDCFSYFEKNLTDDQDFKETYWDYISFACNAKNAGRCYFQVFFDDDQGYVTRCKKYLDTIHTYDIQPVSLKRPEKLEN